MLGLFYACSSDDEWYFAIENYVLVENCHANIKILHPRGLAAQFVVLVMRKLVGSQYISLQK